MLKFRLRERLTVEEVVGPEWMMKWVVTENERSLEI